MDPLGLTAKKESPDRQVQALSQASLGKSVEFDGYRFYDPQYGLMSSRPGARYRLTDPDYGRDTSNDAYFGNHVSTAYSEIREKTRPEQNIYRGKIKVDNVLDLSDPEIRKAYGVDTKKLTELVDDPDEYVKYTNPLSNRAYEDGYNGIIFPSSRSPGGKNLFVYGDRKDAMETTTIFDVKVDK